MKPSWKRKNAVRNALSLSNPNPDVPKTPPASTPNITAKPKSQKSDAATRKFAKFLIATLIEFFDRTSPLSRAVKPACMKKTSAAQTSSHAMSTGATFGTGSPGQRWRTVPRAGPGTPGHRAASYPDMSLLTIEVDPIEVSWRRDQP